MQILLVSSLRKSDDWTLPKGGWESDESAAESASREACMSCPSIHVLSQERQFSLYLLCLDVWPFVIRKVAIIFLRSKE